MPTACNMPSVTPSRLTPPCWRGQLLGSDFAALAAGAEPSATSARPEVVSGVVEVFAAGLLGARRCSALVDVGPEQVLGADEVTRRILEDQELVGGRSVLEAGRSG